jgi:hypothetical protein
MLSRRREKKEQEIISSKGHVILLTHTYTYIHIHSTQPDLFISQGPITGFDIIILLTANGIRSACIIKEKGRAVYLVVHSDIQHILKDNDNKLKLFEKLAEYNNHH